MFKVIHPWKKKIEMNESYEEKIKRLRPIDDDFFKIYIHPIEIVKVIVEAILHKDVIISHCQSEAVMKNIAGRTVEFDLYAKTEDDIYINIEIQKNKDRAIPKRANLHMASLTSFITYPGQLYDNLQKRYVVHEYRGYVSSNTKRKS